MCVPAEGVEATSYALAELGGLVLAVPVSHVEQAVPRPLKPSPLPRVRPSLAGAFEHRGQMVPVVDLRGCFPAHPWQGADPGQTLVLRCAGRVLGLAVERVLGIRPVPARQVVRLHHDEGGDELFHSVAQLPGLPDPVGLLDVERLTQQLQVWAPAQAAENPGPSDLPGRVAMTLATGLDAQASPTPRDDLADAASPPLPSSLAAQESRWALLGASGIGLGLRATDVGEVLPLPPLQRIFGSGMVLLGVARWRGRDLPVVDVAALLEVKPPRTGDPPWMAVLQGDGLCIGVGVDAIDALRTWRTDALGDAAHAGLPRPGLYAGVSPLAQGGLWHLLDTSALIDACPASELSRDRRSTAVAEAIGLAAPLAAEGAGQAIEDHAYVVLRAGGLWAAPLEEMAEIAPFPGDVLPVDDGPPSQVGVFTWRGHSLPLLDLKAAEAQGRTAPSRQARVVICKRGPQHVGLAVDEVLELLPAHTALRTRLPLGRGRHLHMLTTGRGLSQGSYRVLDLQALGR